MSYLDKLAIRGIRSFDALDFQVIEFYSPLTIIIGQNGSGKTTIIEALKYATTGDMPPNTKGGAFIHDPSIAGTSEVRAVIKLRFYNSRREKMLVERRLQVTKKKGTASGLTMKTLEGTISYADEDKNPKKRNAISTKCSELDEEVPKQLGVSKAILENVIFCHQEESNWPLAEPAALKKKFDDIFEATKYTKALDQIKVLRKEQNVEIKVDKEKLSSLKIDRDRATRLRTVIEKLASSIDVKQSDHEALDVEIKTVAANNKLFYEQATKVDQIIAQVDTLRRQRNLVQENAVHILSTAKELNDTDAELKAKISNHSASLDTARAEREKYGHSLSDETDKLGSSERKRSQAQTAHGRLLAEQQRHLDTIEARQRLVQEIATRHQIPGFDHQLTDGEIIDFEDKLGLAITAQQKKIETLKDEARKTEQEHQRQIQNLRSAQAADERTKNSVVEQIQSYNMRITALNRSIDRVTTTLVDITEKRRSLTEDKTRKTDLESKILAASYAASLSSKNRELRDLEEKRAALHVELTGLNMQADVRAKLGLKRVEIQRKNDAVQALVTQSTMAYRRFTKTEPLPTTMEQEVDGVMHTLNNDLLGAEGTAKESTRDLQTIETSYKLAQTKLTELQTSAAALKRKIVQGLRDLDTENDTVAAAIAEAQAEVELARPEVTNAEGISNFFALLLKNGKAHQLCIGCERKLSDQELDDFETYCLRRQADAPAGIKAAKDDLAGWETQLRDLQALVPSELTLTRMNTEEIPRAEAAVASWAGKRPLAVQKSEEAATRLIELKASIQDLQQLKRTASDVGRLHRECRSAEQDVAALESELSATGSTSTSDEIQAQLAALAESVRLIKTFIETLRSEETKQNSLVQTLSNSIHSREMDLASKERELKDKEGLEKQKEEAQTAIKGFEVQLRDLTDKIASGAAPLRKLETELAAFRSENVGADAIASRQLQAYNKSSEQLDLNSNEIKSYARRGSEAALVKCVHELTQHDKVISDTKALLVSYQAKITAADKSLADAQSILRNFEDNLRLRKMRKEADEITSRIEALDEEGARKSSRTYTEKYDVQRKHQGDLSARQAKLGGEIETNRAELDSKKDEMKSEYKDIEVRYKTELIKVKTAETANLDLEKYAKALDNAIMTFHGVKMSEINKTIAELWTKTYQGVDIDNISIKSDSEGKGVGGRSYNYRVVMVKDQTEMDMRGRCSAGQKVLASIIIRLALSESFGFNCGILALDEPTTNLDKDNIEALASSLAELIKDRQGQPNFQLIVITHDEEFLRTLGGSSTLDKYWRVSRNGANGQTSAIERQRLT